MEIEVFADEIIDRKYICFGVLFVPLQNKPHLTKILKNIRCQGKGMSFCWNFEECPYNARCRANLHDLNNAEIHYKNLKGRATKNIASSWLKYVLKQFRKDSRLFYFLINYIELDKMGMDNFGYKNQIENIYNRFFRSNLLYGSQKFFSGNAAKVNIKNIYHDKSDSKEGHEYFPWHAGHKINSENHKKVFIENEDIIFLDSDHKFYFENTEDYINESQLIQLIDLILGTVNQNIYAKSENKYKMEVAMQIRPILKNLLEKIYDGYWDKYKNHVTISFFPKNQITDYEKSFRPKTRHIPPGQYYYHKQLKMPEYSVLKQTNLDIF